MCVSSSCGYTYVQLTWRRESGLALDPQRRGRDPAEKDGEIPYVTPAFQIGIQIIRFRRFVYMFFDYCNCINASRRSRLLLLACVRSLAQRARAWQPLAQRRVVAHQAGTPYTSRLSSLVRCEKLTDTSPIQIRFHGPTCPSYEPDASTDKCLKHATASHHTWPLSTDTAREIESTGRGQEGFDRSSAHANQRLACSIASRMLQTYRATPAKPSLAAA